MYLTIWLFVFLYFKFDMMNRGQFESDIFSVCESSQQEAETCWRGGHETRARTPRRSSKGGGMSGPKSLATWQTWPPDKLPNIGEHDIDIQNNSPESWVGMAYNGCWSMLITKILKYTKAWHPSAEPNEANFIVFHARTCVFLNANASPFFFGGQFVFCYTSNKNNSIYVYNMCIS